MSSDDPYASTNDPYEEDTNAYEEDGTDSTTEDGTGSTTEDGTGSTTGSGAGSTTGDGTGSTTGSGTGSTTGSGTDDPYEDDDDPYEDDDDPYEDDEEDEEDGTDPDEPIVLDMAGTGQSIELSLDSENDQVNVTLDFDLSEFEVFADGNPFSSEPLPEDDLALFGPEPSPAPQDGYMLETRVESMNILSLGNAVRRGELDTVQIGKAKGIVDIVSGTETATVGGKIREHNGHGLNYVASRVESTIGGRMSITSRFEDSIMLGGAMTDTWVGATMIGAGMSDDLCAGAGVRVTAPVDLWLNMLTGMEERPGTVAADGVFVEACGTLLEREYGPSVYAVGTGTWTGTTYLTTKSGFRPLMRVAMGVRNLVPGAGAASEEQAPPSPPPAAAAGGAVAGAGLVMGGANMARAGLNVGLAGDGMFDAMRAGSAVADASGAHNIADLRRTADTATQLEDLRTGVANANLDARNAMLDAWDDSANTLYAAAKKAETVDPARAAVLEDVANHLDIAKLQVHGREDPRPYLLEKAAELERLGYTNEALVLRKAADTYDEFLSAGISVRPAAELPPPQADEGEYAHASEVSEAPVGGHNDYPYAAPDDLVDDELAYASTHASTTPVDAMPPEVVKAKYDLCRGWMYESMDMLAEAEVIAPQVGPVTDADAALRADATRDAAARLDIARADVLKGVDPRPGLKGAADQLELLGHTDQAAVLRKAIEEYDEFLASMRVLGTDGELPPGVLDFHKDIAPPDLPDSNIYDEIHHYGVLEDPSAVPADNISPGTGDGAISGPAPGRQPDAPFEDVPGYTATADAITPSTVDGVTSKPVPVRKSFARLEVPGFRLPDPEIDGSRHLVAIEPEQAVGAAEDAAGAARRQAETGSGATDVARADLDPGGAGPAAQPQLDEGGARWEVEVESRSPDPDTGEPLTEGSYADVSHHGATDGDGVAGGTGPAQADPPDTRAVVDAMPDGNVSDDGSYLSLADARAEAAETPGWKEWFGQVDEIEKADNSPEWAQMNDQLYKQYMVYRRDSHWRGTMAYGEAIDKMRTDLVQALVDVGGYTDEAANNMSDARAAYNALAGVVEQAGKTEDWATVQRVGGFLDAFDAKTQDTITDLASRSDELDGVKNYEGSSTAGSVHDLDHAIDREKLAAEFESRQLDAGTRMQEAADAGDTALVERLNDEMTYYQQMGSALERGRNPLTESGDQIAYLRSVGRKEQADEYLELQSQLVATMSDPEYHKTAKELGPTSVGTDFQRLLDIRLEQAGLGPRRTDLGASSQPSRTITYVPGAAENIKLEDFLRADLDESGGAAVHGDAGVPATTGDYAAGRDMVNQQLGDTDYVRAPEEQPKWVHGTDVAEQLEEARWNRYMQKSGDTRSYMDARLAQVHGVPMEGPEELEVWMRTRGGNKFMGRKPSYLGDRTPERATIDGIVLTKHGDPVAFRNARSYWNQATRIQAANEVWGAMPHVDQRSFTQWKGRPPGMRSWKSPTQQAAKGVKFGDAKILHYAQDTVGIGDTSRAAQHVQVPSDWVPTRQPGFGRTASASGDFPFSVREKLLNSLMQGQRSDPENLSALTEGVSARTRRYSAAAEGSDGMKMWMLLRDLRTTLLATGAYAPDFARGLDAKTLRKLLDLFESSATLA